MHPLNKLLISVTDDVSKNDKSSDLNWLQSENISPILLIEVVWKFVKIISLIEVHCLNIWYVLFNIEEFKWDKST